MEQPVKLLLVDDDSRNLDALEIILSGTNYELIRALSGDAALSALLKNDVAAIVLDINMPDLNGVELARMIKGSRRFSEIPILFLTAHLLDDRDVVAGYGVGAVDYLVKPVNPAVFRQKIGVFTDLFRKRRALAELNETLEARVQERTAELAKSEAALRQADRQKDEFLATLAHELRNPLAPLRMGLDLLDRSATDLQRGTLTIMRRQLEHMVHLIDDLLDVARISGGKIELKKETVSIQEAISTALETTRPFFDRRRQSVSVEMQEPLVAQADPTRLTQIVTNLLHNASKFTPEQGQVKVELSYQAPQAVIRVSDPGVGLDPDELPLVFDMFTRVSRPGHARNSGLGIGLALSRRLAQLHGGDIAVTSAGLGHGSTFTVTLPAERGTPPSAGGSLAEPPRQRAPAEVGVLIIGDSHDSAEMLAAALEDRGYSTCTAGDGETGLALIREQRPKFVICDIGLPEMDGLEVCRRVRSSDLGYTPIMIALTGWGMREDLKRTTEAGFDRHLVKPVGPAALFGLLGGLASAAG